MSVLCIKLQTFNIKPTKHPTHVWGNELNRQFLKQEEQTDSHLKKGSGMLSHLEDENWFENLSYSSHQENSC